MSGFTIRAFLPDDQEAARSLILAGLAEHFGWADEAANPDIDDIAASYLAGGHIFLIAELDGLLVGTAGLLLEEGKSGRVVRVSVTQAHRRQGIARMLLLQLCRAARARGLARLWVETNDDWDDANSLYLALGFVETARYEGSTYFALCLSPRNSGDKPA